MANPNSFRDAATTAVLQMSEALFELGLDDEFVDDDLTVITKDKNSPSERFFSEHIRAGKKIGRYELIRELGEGGFGTVWLAEQKEPIHRETAIKLIKPGMSSRHVIARFESEQQTLAMMQHPNIAAVLDAGTTEYDLPYFVMEVVRGAPITKYCDDRKLPLRKRLELFLPVCQAVNHAHQKAILHRDLKPSNILVGELDGEAEPKIIDFGIAKALGAAPREQMDASALYTAQGQVIGTPQYMSPEQAGGGGSMDTRSDIYALGAILYELLVGVPPLSDRFSNTTAYDAILHVIRDVEPTRPSHRVGTGEPDKRIRQAVLDRQSEIPRLSQDLRGDLDWIVLKALEKEPARRYESAAALALDIERHLNDQPVAARPPSRLYVLRKFARRNRTAVIYGILAVVAITSALTVALRGFFREREALKKTVAAEQLARNEMEKNVQASVFLGNLFKDITILNRHVVTADALKNILDSANDRRATELRQQAEVDEGVSRILAEAYRELDQLGRAEDLYSNSLRLLRVAGKGRTLEAAQCLFWISWLHSHRQPWDSMLITAETDAANIQECLSILASLPNVPKEFQLRVRVLEAGVLRQSGRIEEAVRILNDLQNGPERSLVMSTEVSGWLWRELALLALHRKSYDEAEGYLDLAERLLISAAPSDNTRFQVKADILALKSLVQSKAGYYYESLQTSEEEDAVRVVWLGRSDSGVLVRMADALVKTGDLAQAEGKLSLAVGIARNDGDFTTLEVALQRILDIQTKKGLQEQSTALAYTVQLAEVLFNQLDRLVENPKAWQAKLTQIQKLLEIRERYVGDIPPEVRPLLLANAAMLVRRGEFHAALKELDVVSQMEPRDMALEYRRAVYGLALNQPEHTDAVLQKLLSVGPEESKSYFHTYWVCRIVVLCPSTRLRYAQAQSLLARQSLMDAVHEGLTDDWTRLFYGIMEYLNGAYPSAQDWLDGVVQSPEPIIAAQALLFSSLNQLSQGREDQARTYLQQATKIYEQSFEPFASSDSSPPLYDTLTVKLLLKEVTETIKKGKGKGDAK